MCFLFGFESLETFVFFPFLLDSPQPSFFCLPDILAFVCCALPARLEPGIVPGPVGVGEEERVGFGEGVGELGRGVVRGRVPVFG